MLYDQRWELDEVGRAMHRAADLIEDRGWCQGKLRNSRGQICAHMAMLKAAKEINVFNVGLGVMLGRVCRHLGVSAAAWRR
jgi:hypothetical protein